MGDRYTIFFDSSDPSQIDTGHQNEWADIEMPDGTVKKCEDPRSPTGHKWIGYTLFIPLDRPTADKNAEQQTDDKSALKPKMLKIPGEPSESERRLHELTHLPYRDWCEHCVKSKGRQSHAVKKNDRQPVIQIDFSFLSTENDLPKRTILNATDVQTGYAMAIVLPAKGSIEKYAVAELRLRRFVFEIGRTFGIVQYDKENSLKVIVKDLGKTIGGLSMRSTDWTLPESRKCRKCAEDLAWSTEDTVLASARVDWLEVDIGISNVHLARETCSMADQRYLIGPDGACLVSGLTQNCKSAIQ